jgi:septal ring factor EnvC (AmiA/AmiB activator)
MRPLRVIKVLLVVPAALCVFNIAAAGASERELVTKEKKLEDIERQIREADESIKEYTKTETSILGELERINMELVEKREDIRKVNVSLGSLGAEMKRVDANLGALEKERKELRARLAARLGAMYKMRSGAALKLLFMSDTQGDLGRRYKYMSMIMESDSRLIRKSEKNLELLEEERRRMDLLREDLGTKKGRLQRARGRIEARLGDKRGFLDGVKREKSKRIELRREFEGAKKELAELIARLRKDARVPGKSEFSRMKGRLVMPVVGRVVSSYGKVRHPLFNTVTFNNGIVIAAPFASEVRSVYTGAVVYVGWLKGYGQVMIIDHGGGFYTLYGHLYRVLKAKGDGVRKAEVVGLVGDSGAEEVSGLYFEVRQGGVPRDPLGWIAGR